MATRRVVATSSSSTPVARGTTATTTTTTTRGTATASTTPAGGGDRPAIIIDNGSSSLKVGFGGEEKPRHLIPAVVGLQRGQAASRRAPLTIGEAALEKIKTPGLTTLKYPIMRGQVMDFEWMEEMWSYSLNKLALADASQHPVMMTANAYTPQEHRQTMAEICFESFNAPAFYVAIPGFLSLYATGQTSGVVVESGDSLTHIVPVSHGIALPHSVVRMPIAGQDITDYLGKQILERGFSLAPKEEHRLLSRIKHSMVYVAADFEEEWYACKTSPKQFDQSLELPTGEKITLGSECFKAAEVLFTPSIVGAESVGLPELVYDTIAKCDSSLRKAMYSNIVLGGGNMLLRGMAARIEKDIKDVMTQNKQTVKDVKVTSTKEHSAWQGASSLALNPELKAGWVTKKEYDENGPSIVNRKCF